MTESKLRTKIITHIGAKFDENYRWPVSFGKIDKKADPRLENIKSDGVFILDAPQSSENFYGKLQAELLLGGKTYQVISKLDNVYIQPEIEEKLKFFTKDKKFQLHCRFERSAGSIIYRVDNGKRFYLLIKNKCSENWGFPKGHLEKGEDDVDAAIREVSEETGLDIVPEENFAEYSKYSMRNGVEKTVAVFISEISLNQDVILQAEEVSDSVFLPFESALERLTFDNDVKILREAEKYLKEVKR